MHRFKTIRHVVWLILVWMALVPRADGQPTSVQAPQTVDLIEGWQYRWGDSPLDDAGLPVWAYGDLSASGWRPFSFTDPPADRQGRHFLWIRVRLPKGRRPNPSLYLSEILVAGEAYLDGRRIYRTGKFEPLAENKYRTSSWHLVPLPADCAEKMLALRIYSNYDEVIGILDPPRFGYQADVIRSIFQERIDSIIFGVLFIFLGPASLLFYLKRRGQGFVEYLSFGGFTTCMGVHFVLRGSGPGLLAYAPAGAYFLGHMSFYLFPVGLFAFFEQALGPGPRRLMRRIWQFHILFAAFGLALDLLDIMALPILQAYLLGILAFDVFYTLWVGARAALRGSVEARIVSAGAGVLVLSGLHDILATYGFIPDWHTLFEWGTIAFVISLAYTLERRFIENHRRLLRTNEELQDEISERRQAEEALRKAHAEVERLKDRLQTENIYLQEEIKLEHNFQEIITRSEPLKKVLRQVEQVASTDSTVLILGETGTGKELLARAVHNISARRNRPLVKVNCAALPANLIESELFGHERGAFTGALSRKIGRFELADGGTIFLDEIGDLPLELQAKLLRVLQEGEFERLGDSRTLKVDARVIAATNRDLEGAIESGDFREDLFYRLNVFPIQCPPLREHKDDIPLLVNHFIKKYSAKAGKGIEHVSQQVMDALQAYRWPGNVRELENMVERGVIVSRGKQLEFGDWLPKTGVPSGTSSTATLEELERDHILKVLELTGWRVSGEKGAAKILGLKRTTLEARMKKMGITRK